MKSKILCVFMLGIHSAAFAAASYEIYATVTEPESKLVFPAFKVSATDPNGTSFVDGCTYVGKLTEQNENSVQLEAIMSCSRNEAGYHMDMPIFVLSSKGQSASYELVEDEAVMWKYDIELKPIPERHIANKLFKSDSTRVAFALCVKFNDYGGMRRLRYCVPHTLTRRYVVGEKL